MGSGLIDGALGRTLTGVLLIVLATLPTSAAPGADAPSDALEGAQRLFYTSRFADAAAETRRILAVHPGHLPALELRTSALHFQVRRASGDRKDRKAAMAACTPCGPLLAEFLDEVTRGKAAAKARLQAEPDDIEAMYYLAKIDLSYLWMQLGTLGKRTGWDEYWEAKRLLESVLEQQPHHVRAQVAEAWMDYIVGTRVPWGTRWIMGGGNRDRALKSLRAVAGATGEFFAEVEADFALWEMLVRDGRRDEAVPIARALLQRFPHNEELAKFIAES
jgi:tetratricopeptide (TPR) repeat protein